MIQSAQRKPDAGDQSLKASASQERRAQRQNNRRVGTDYEQLAAKYLRGQGYRILECNYRTKRGEIDLIASKNRVIVFVEVKYRRTRGCGAPSEAVDYRKQRRISHAAAYYLVSRGLWERSACRFDVIEIQGETLRHIENAFCYVEY